jgi:hypothetical protein
MKARMKQAKHTGLPRPSESSACAAQAVQADFVEYLLVNEITAVSHKIEAFEAVIAGRLVDAFGQIDEVLALYERHPSYIKLDAGQFQTLPGLLDACISISEEPASIAALSTIDLLSRRLEALGQTRIH